MPLNAVRSGGGGGAVAPPEIFKAIFFSLKSLHFQIVLGPVKLIVACPDFLKMRRRGTMLFDIWYFSKDGCCMYK